MAFNTVGSTGVQQTLYKKYLGYANTGLDISQEYQVNAAPKIFASQILSQSIPETAPTDITVNVSIISTHYKKTPNSLPTNYTYNKYTSNVYNYIKKYEKLQLISFNDSSYIHQECNPDGTVNITLGNLLINTIPSNYDKGGSYDITLYFKQGEDFITIPKNNYIFDRDAGIITFYNYSFVSSDNPPLITFWRYEGGFGLQGSSFNSLLTANGGISGTTANFNGLTVSGGISGTTGIFSNLLTANGGISGTTANFNGLTVSGGISGDNLTFNNITSNNGLISNGSSTFNNDVYIKKYTNNTNTFSFSSLVDSSSSSSHSSFTSSNKIGNYYTWYTWNPDDTGYKSSAYELWAYPATKPAITVDQYARVTNQNGLDVLPGYSTYEIPSSVKNVQCMTVINNTIYYISTETSAKLYKIDKDKGSIPVLVCTIGLGTNITSFDGYIESNKLYIYYYSTNNPNRITAFYVNLNQVNPPTSGLTQYNLDNNIINGSTITLSNVITGIDVSLIKIKISSGYKQIIVNDKSDGQVQIYTLGVNGALKYEAGKYKGVRITGLTLINQEIFFSFVNDFVYIIESDFTLSNTYKYYYYNIANVANENMPDTGGISKNSIGFGTIDKAAEAGYDFSKINSFNINPTDSIFIITVDNLNITNVISSLLYIFSYSDSSVTKILSTYSYTDDDSKIPIKSIKNIYSKSASDYYLVDNNNRLLRHGYNIKPALTVSGGLSIKNGLNSLGIYDNIFNGPIYTKNGSGIASDGAITATGGITSSGLNVSGGIIGTTGTFSSLLTANGGLSVSGGPININGGNGMVSSGLITATGGLSGTAGTFSSLLTAKGGLSVKDESGNTDYVTVSPSSGLLTANYGITGSAGTFSSLLTANGGLSVSGGPININGGNGMVSSGLITATGGLSGTAGTFSSLLTANGGLTVSGLTQTQALTSSGLLTANNGVKTSIVNSDTSISLKNTNTIGINKERINIGTDGIVKINQADLLLNNTTTTSTEIYNPTNNSGVSVTSMSVIGGVTYYFRSDSTFFKFNGANTTSITSIPGGLNITTFDGYVSGTTLYIYYYSSANNGFIGRLNVNVSTNGYISNSINASFIAASNTNKIKVVNYSGKNRLIYTNTTNNTVNIINLNTDGTADGTSMIITGFFSLNNDIFFGLDGTNLYIFDSEFTSDNNYKYYYRSLNDVANNVYIETISKSVNFGNVFIKNMDIAVSAGVDFSKLNSVDFSPSNNILSFSVNDSSSATGQPLLYYYNILFDNINIVLYKSLTLLNLKQNVINTSNNFTALDNNGRIIINTFYFINKESLIVKGDSNFYGPIYTKNGNGIVSSGLLTAQNGLNISNGGLNGTSGTFSSLLTVNDGLTVSGKFLTNKMSVKPVFNGSLILQLTDAGYYLPFTTGGNSDCTVTLPTVTSSQSGYIFNIINRDLNLSIKIKDNLSNIIVILYPSQVFTAVSSADTDNDWIILSP